MFADDSENEQTFYGFSDSEIGDHWVGHVSLKCGKNQHHSCHKIVLSNMVIDPNINTDDSLKDYKSMFTFSKMEVYAALQYGYNQ